ncbi:MAG: ribosome maturation factor RimM [Thermoflexales bacterium]|nr:ribosome maturation factor RimM [Thermoflexales bacterium]
MPRAPSLIELGRVTRGHGIRGELKVDGAPALIEALPGIKRVVIVPASPHPRATEHFGALVGFAARVRQCRLHQGAALLLADGVDTRNDAEALRGARIHVRTSDLPRLDAGEYYAHDLIGLRVIDVAGAEIGELADVLATGANDVYVVRSADGERLLPAIESVVRAIDLAAGTMTVIIPEGL